MESDEVPIPIIWKYAVVHSVDGRRVAFNEEPEHIIPGSHAIEMKLGKCLAPVLTIACDLQPSTTANKDFQFVGGKKYQLTLSGEIVEK